MPDPGYCCVGFTYCSDCAQQWRTHAAPSNECSVEYLNSYYIEAGLELRIFYTRWYPDGSWVDANQACGPDPIACCVGRDCHETPFANCYDIGGEPIPIWLFDAPVRTSWVPTCLHVECGDPTWCCREYTDGRHTCRVTSSVAQCEDESLWPPGVDIAYPIPDGSSCDSICGKDIACCLSSGGCADMTWRQCEARGGEHSGTCLTCADEGPCCPIPVPCCLCGGDCLMLLPRECDSLGGVSVPGLANCQEAAPFCENINLRLPCRSGSWMVVPSRADPEQYELLSTAAIEIEDYADQTVLQHHYAHVGDQPWLCHRWDEPRDLYEKSICGVALNEGGNLGGCIPEGHGGIICGWEPPCPEIP